LVDAHTFQGTPNDSPSGCLSKIHVLRKSQRPAGGNTEMIPDVALAGYLERKNNGGGE